ncbi:LuxR C-terminal-related transcriptional regulator [Pseudomonas sp. P97.38]|uniref:helix-turn-helix transcriptional regulator n=1 Tax=Pseudomonas sp. P97.38 TaxID=255451 RepID=UPI00069F553A|nr:LuxR C-terminal-related transcriptional regulator [Pseudomonas sp. P97.38]
MGQWDTEKLQAITSSQLIKSAFEDFQSSAAQLGFNRCSILVFSTNDCNTPLLTLNNLPTTWNEYFQRQYDYRNNPIVKYCHHSLLPVLWSKPLFESVPGLWEDLNFFQLQYGISHPVQDHRGVTSIFSFLQDEPATSIKDFHGRVGAMLWLATRTHTHLIDQLLTTLRPLRLSQRELDVLKWTAEGKTSGEVATILSISERTVNFHIQAIISKLDVKNKTSAVTTAVRKGLI